MRRLGVLTVCMASLLTVFSLVSGRAYSGGAQPKVEVKPDTFDFGTVEEGAKPMAVFTIKNVGNADLIIYDAKPSCGCTVAKLSSKNLAPGQEATLEAVYNSHNASGAVSKSVSINTNDNAVPVVVVRITGNVKAVPGPEASLSVYNLSNLQLPVGGSDKRSISLSNTGELELTISEVSATPGLTATLDQYAIEPGKTTKVTLKLKPGETRVMDVTIAPKATTGSFQEVLTIKSDAKRKPTMMFIAQGNIQ